MEGLVELATDMWEHLCGSGVLLLHTGMEAGDPVTVAVVKGVGPHPLPASGSQASAAEPRREAHPLPAAGSQASAAEPGREAPAAPGLLQTEAPAAPPGLLQTEAPAAPGLLQTLMPGYFEGSFLMRVSGVQCLGFAAALVVGHVGILPTMCSLYTLGAAWGPGIAMGQLWRLGAPIFLHASLPHLIMNLLFQLRLGMDLEHKLGSSRFAAMYVISGAFGNAVSAAFDPWKVAVGCSTSGLGILGGNIAAAALSGSQMGSWLTYLGLVVAVGALGTGNTDVYGHIAGFVGGACLTVILFSREQSRACGLAGSVSSLRLLALATLLGSTALASSHLRHVPPTLLDCSGLLA